MVAPRDCAGSPIPDREEAGFSLQFRNEAGRPLNSVIRTGRTRVARLQVGKDLPVDGAFGSLQFLFFQTFVGPTGPPDVVVQGWMMPLMTARGRFSVGLNATQTGRFCR